MYIKTNWENEPSESTPINASNLNKIEQGIYDNSLGVATIGDITELDTTDKTSVVNAINENVDNISKIGKKLWEGTFTSGSITVDGLDDYTVFIFVLDPTIYCIGSKNWGIGGIGTYGSYTTQLYNYRFGVSGNTLTINNENRGGSNGSSNVAIKAIYGLF